MKVFNKKAEVDYCGRWSTVEEPTFLLRLGHVTTELGSEEETVGQWAGVLKMACCYPVGAALLITRLLNKTTRQTNTDISL